jgi:SAM-dependent methyltransferase
MGTTALVGSGTSVDYTGVKQKQRATWGSGDYGVVAATIQVVAENLCEAVDLRAGARVLDAASGTGNAALAAARRFCDVVGVDYVPALLERARERSAAERLPLELQEADVEHLPFPDASFDVVLSTFGVMFAPDQERTASELLRVCRPGGKIGLANWTPDSLVGSLFRLVGRFVPPPAGVRSPALWGVPERVAELFGGASQIRVQPRQSVFRFRSAAHWIDVFRGYYGPVERAFAALPPARQAALEAEIHQLLAAFNRSGDDTLVAPSEYLEIVVVR